MLKIGREAEGVGKDVVVVPSETTVEDPFREPDRIDGDETVRAARLG
jgi:hypothetical protein